MIRIHIHVDKDLADHARRTKWLPKSKKMRIALATLVLVIPVVAIASPVTIPNSFTAGEVISSSEVNANFAAAATAVNDNDGRLTALEGAGLLPSAAGVLAYVAADVSGGSILRSYNSEGGTNTITGSNGSYTVTLGGIDCDSAGLGTGIAQVTPRASGGGTAVTCRIQGPDWSTVNGNCVFIVTCYSGGNLRASAINVLYIR